MANDPTVLENRPRIDPRQQAILDSFDYHRPSPEQGERIETNRRAFKFVAVTVIETTPSGPDQTAALRQLHEAMMTANKAIACEPGTERVPSEWTAHTAAGAPEPEVVVDDAPGSGPFLPDGSEPT